MKIGPNKILYRRKALVPGNPLKPPNRKIPYHKPHPTTPLPISLLIFVELNANGRQLGTLRNDPKTQLKALVKEQG